MTRCKRRDFRAGLLLALASMSIAGSPRSAVWPYGADAQERETTSRDTRRPADTGLIRLGTTHSRAQVAAWLDVNRFVVGRWDGTLTLFRTMANESEFGPVLLEALATPSKKGVEMVARVGAGTFVSSNDSQSLVLWRQADHGFSPLPLPYAPEYGTAVSGIRIEQDDQALLLVGHQHGYVTIWSLGHAPSPSPLTGTPTTGTPTTGTPTTGTPTTGVCVPRFVRGISVRSDDPIRWRWQSWHVRGLAACGAGRAISVAEDGDLCLFELPAGNILWRRRYNATAQRGLNDVAVRDDLVAVVNCAVGNQEPNLWFYRIVGNSLEPIANQQLILGENRDQVFTFSVELFEFDGQPHFVASTEEGLIWLGTLKDNKITILNRTKVAVEGGVVLALNPGNKTVLSVGHKIETFAVGPRPLKKETAQP